MLAKVNSGAVNGIDAVPVEVEVDITHGFPHVAIVGMDPILFRFPTIGSGAERWRGDRHTVSEAGSDFNG